MTDCSKIPTLTLVEDSKRAMEDTVAFAGSPENTYTSELDGGVKKTITGVTKDALNAFRLGAGDPQGDYSIGVTYDEPNWTYTYNGQQWGLSKDFDLSTLPYTTTEVDPNNDINLAVRGDASQEYVQTEVTRGQGEVIRGVVFPFDDGVVSNGDEIPSGVRFIRVDINNQPTLVEMYPVSSGSVSLITDYGATIGTTPVSFLDIGEVHSTFSPLQSDAVLNSKIAADAVNAGKKIKLISDAYFEPLGSVVSNDVTFVGEKSPKMKFVGSGTMFKLQDGLSVYNSGLDYEVEVGESVKYFDYENPDGKLRIAWFADFKIDGSLQLVNPSTGLNLDPTVVDFGIDHIYIGPGNTKNMVDQMCLVNSTPYKTLKVEDVHGRNNKLLTISNPVQNFHPFYENIQKAMVSLEVNNVTLENDRGFFAEATGGTYAGIVLWEGYKASVKNTRCEGVVTSDGTPVYDFYMAGIDVETEGCVMKDCYAFNFDGNTGLKIKKVENCDAARKRAYFSDDFFDYWQTNHGLLLSNSGGNPWTIDLESIGGTYSIDNSELICPFSHSNGRQKATQELSKFSLTNSKIAVKSGVAPYFVTARWTPTLKDQDKFVVVRNNDFDIETDDAFYLAKMDINQGTPDGGFIDLSENTIRAKGGVYELLITTTDTDNKDTVLDFLKVGNKVYTEGNYQQVKNFCKLPTVKNTDFSNSQVQMNTTGNEIFYGVNPMGDGASTGDFKHVQKGTPGRVDAIAFHRPQSSKVSSGRILVNGHVQYDEVIRNFNTYIDITPNETNNTIDITIPVLAGGVQTITWSGSTGILTYLDLGYDINEPFVMIMRRNDDYVYFSFEYRSGSEPSYAALNWNYSAS
ncbi:tail tubular protein [Vibrio phage Artemius]|nr:tail tubular protein [Vibrio phage Artemius]